MAEAFGVVAGALSIAALFNSCVESFQYIQLGRRFEQDYEGYRLRLDVAQVRLSRWGQAVQINDSPRFVQLRLDDKEAQLAKSILEQIATLFESARRKSRQYEQAAENQALLVFDDEAMGRTNQRLHEKLTQRFRTTRKQPSLVKRTSWALYDARNLERLVGQISSFVEELEELFPAEATTRRLADIDIQGIEDEESLQALRAAAEHIDSVLRNAVVRKMNAIAGRTSVRDIKVGNHATVHVGNYFSENLLFAGLAHAGSVTISVETIMAGGESRTHVGNNFGGRGILEGCS
ncbi:small s protein [Colletotrichum plurivorum]|uniref:Small s protein n=1 Tax=Colletotrichum plurivorum TaxID=2175906 RepID=A0A8H6MVG8_9PEZI|nr:small s protein [Colletotrichum plurivorum]